MIETLLTEANKKAIELYGHSEITKCSNLGTWEECLQVVTLGSRKFAVLYFNVGKSTHAVTAPIQ